MNDDFFREILPYSAIGFTHKRQKQDKAAKIAAAQVTKTYTSQYFTILHNTSQYSIILHNQLRDHTCILHNCLVIISKFFELRFLLPS